jgi:hypothetical protein
MSAANRPLRVDQIARGLFGRAAMAVGMHDAEAALEICRTLGEIENDYALTLKCGGEQFRSTSKLGSEDPVAARREANDAPQSPRRFTGRPMHAKFASKCHVCNGGISEGSSILYSRELRRAVHDSCGEIAG